jgi:hypothetical protein
MLRPSLSIHQPLDIKIRLAVIDHLFFPPRHCFGGVFHWGDIQRLLHLLMGGNTPDAQAKIFAQHRDGNRAAHHCPCFLRSWLTAVVVMAHLDGR